jgi:hypothetical protein
MHSATLQMPIDRAPQSPRQWNRLVTRCHVENKQLKLLNHQLKCILVAFLIGGLGDTLYDFGVQTLVKRPLVVDPRCTEITGSVAKLQGTDLVSGKVCVLVPFSHLKLTTFLRGLLTIIMLEYRTFTCTWSWITSNWHL